MTSLDIPPLPITTKIPPIPSIEMHTAGEPTRIFWTNIISNAKGTLLEQRTQAKAHHDKIRRLLMLEPRGHYDMYGAILCRDTELVASGQAHMGVLFTHNEGFSMMCGHATIALGRFLVDVEDERIFPRRSLLKSDPGSGETRLSLHVPCGVVEVTVPTLESGKSDPSRPVSFVSVPSYATAISLEIPLPEGYRWPELAGRASVTVDVAYGGAYYCLISVEELGFAGGLAEVELQKMDHATKLLKGAIMINEELAYVTRDIESGEQGYLYGVMVTDWKLGHVVAPEGTAAWKVQQGVQSEETGLCFFADQQIDRSPTGGCVAARVALAYARGTLAAGEKRVYNSLFTRRFEGLPGFAGSVIDSVDGRPWVRVLVEGYGYYTGSHSFVVETEDGFGVDGFSIRDITK